MRAAYYMIYLSVVLITVALLASSFADVPANQQLAVIGAGATLSPVQRIKAGDINCPNCDLSGADLTNQCVKNGNLSGAKFDGATAHYMCMSQANFAGASFRGTDLTGANLANSDLSGADLTGAVLSLTSIKGTNLATVTGLTQAQVDMACGDASTRLPPGLSVKTCL